MNQPELSPENRKRFFVFREICFLVRFRLVDDRYTSMKIFGKLYLASASFYFILDVWKIHLFFVLDLFLFSEFFCFPTLRDDFALFLVHHLCLHLSLFLFRVFFLSRYFFATIQNSFPTPKINLNTGTTAGPHHHHHHHHGKRCGWNDGTG